MWITSVIIPMWAVAVAYSRWLLGVHTALDVIIGGAVGIGWGLAAFLVVRKFVESKAGD
jgi:membrane-associated phospholipid phosphatase